MYSPWGVRSPWGEGMYACLPACLLGETERCFRVDGDGDGEIHGGDVTLGRYSLG